MVGPWVYVSPSSRSLTPRLSRSFCVGMSHLRVGTLQSASGSNIFLPAPKRRYVIALRARATPKEAIIITCGDASFLRKPRYTSLSIMIPAAPVSTKAAASVHRRTDQARVPSRGASYIGKK